MGASGGVVGGVAGASTGAALGLPLAPFTFGMSIPGGTLVGAITGIFAGSAVGGSVGAISGSMIGYGAHKHKDAIGCAASGARSKVGAATGEVQQFVGTSK